MEDNMRSVKIFGAGSIGNHLAFACRQMDWDVSVCDIDKSALERMKALIYPERYGKWDSDIKLFLSGDAPDKDYDIVIIGTPPDSHINLALEVLQTRPPNLLLIEKPVCTPSLKQVTELMDIASKKSTIVCVGYNHALGQNTIKAEEILKRGVMGRCVSIESSIKEHWGGIFAAHPWLAGPHQTYLGFWERGGGATGEHSHGIHIWQHFAHILELGRVVEVSSFMDMVKDDKVDYDQAANISVKTDKNLFGYIVQDVVTQPIKKVLRIQGTEGYLSWHINWSAEGDAVFYQQQNKKQQQLLLPKKRADDFRLEVEHLAELLDDPAKKSPISLERGLETMMVIAAAYRSHFEKRTMQIDYSKGFVPEAITSK